MALTLSPSSTWSSAYSSHSPVASTSTSSPPDDNPPASRERSDEPGGAQDVPKRRQKRRGKNMTLLREKYALDRQPSPSPPRAQSGGCLSPASSGSQLAQLELAASLSWHLVSVARQSVKAYNHPNWQDLSQAIEHIHDHLRNPTRTTDVILAALVAIGARRSNHSAITGLATEPPAGLGPPGLYPLQLGQKREGPCRRLVERALELAEASGVLRESSAATVEALSHLRLMMMAVTPRHERFIELDRTAGRHYRQLNQFEQSGQSYVASDAVAALVFDQPLDVQEEELERFGWPRLDVFALKREVDELSYATMADPVLTEKMRRMTVATMRHLASLRAQGWHKNSPDSLPLPARQVFDQTTQLIAVTEATVMAIQAVVPPPDQSSRQLFKNLHLLKLPLAFHAGARKLAAQLVRSDCDPEDAERLEEEATVRQVRWAKRFMQFLAGTISTEMDGYHHALLVDTLDQVMPDWLPLATAAARQHATGQGPFAAVGLSWADLRRFHLCLQWATSVFESCVAKERMLAEALEAVGKGEGRTAHEADMEWVAQAGEEGRRDGGMAGEMVARALAEVGA